MSLTEADLIEGHTYEAKKRKGATLEPRLYNDRYITHVFHDKNEVWYLGAGWTGGTHEKSLTFEQFLRFAGKDVTDELNKGQWFRLNIEEWDRIEALKIATVERDNKIREIDKQIEELKDKRYELSQLPSEY